MFLPCMEPLPIAFRVALLAMLWLSSDVLPANPNWFVGIGGGPTTGTCPKLDAAACAKGEAGLPPLIPRAAMSTSRFSCLMDFVSPLGKSTTHRCTDPSHPRTVPTEPFKCWALAKPLIETAFPGLIVGGVPDGDREPKPRDAGKGDELLALGTPRSPAENVAAMGAIGCLLSRMSVGMGGGIESAENVAAIGCRRSRMSVFIADGIESAENVAAIGCLLSRISVFIADGIESAENVAAIGCVLSRMSVFIADGIESAEKVAAIGCVLSRMSMGIGGGIDWLLGCGFER